MNESHFDELVDSYIKYAGREMLLKLAEEAPTEEEIAQVCVTTDALDSLIMADINKEVSKRRFRRVISMTAKVAAVFFIFITISAFAISGSKALRTRFVNLFIAENDVSLDFSFVDEAESESSNVSVDIKDNIEPGFLPAGYELKESNSVGKNALNRYFNSAGQMLMIKRSSIGASHKIDNENSNIYEIEVMGKPALVMEHPEGNYLFFTTDQFEYSVGGNLDVEVLIMIAEGLK